MEKINIVPNSVAFFCQSISGLGKAAMFVVLLHGCSSPSKSPAPAAGTPVPAETTGPSPTSTPVDPTVGEAAAVTPDAAPNPEAPNELDPAASFTSIESNQIASGSTVVVHVNTKSKNGTFWPVGGAAVTIGLLADGMSTGTIGSTVDLGNGKYTSTITGLLSGTPSTVGVVVNGVVVGGNQVRLQVLPGNPSVVTSTLVVDSASIVSGSSATASVTLRDGIGNTIAGSGSELALEISGGTSTVTQSAHTDLGNGTYTVNLTGVTSGSATSINVKINGVVLTASPLSLVVTVGAASLAQSLLTVSSNSVLSGESVTLTLTRRDAAGNLLTADDPSISFSKISGASNGNFSAPSLQGNGTFTGTFTGIVAGTAAVMSAAIGGNSLSSALPSIQVLVSEISLSQSIVSVGATTVASGATTTIRLTARDANNNRLTSGGSDVEFNLASGTSTGTLSTPIDNLDGTYSATFTGVVVGSATTAKAVVDGADVTPSSEPTITVVPGFLSLTASTISVVAPSIASGVTTEVTVAARDEAGNIIGTGGSIVEVSLVGGTSTALIGAVVDNFDGTYTCSLTGQKSGTATDIMAFIDGSQIVTSNPALTVVVGAFSVSKSLIHASLTQVVSGTTATVTLTALDASDNLVLSGGASVVFSISGGTSTGSFSTVTHSEGTYTSVFTGSTAATP